MTKEIIVPPGVSQKPVHYDSSQVTLETVANELALLQLGDFEPLDFKIDVSQFMSEIQEFSNDWVTYLPRPNTFNNRKSLTLTNLPGKTHRDSPSQAQASVEMGRRVSELEFNEPTEVYQKCDSLKPLLQTFSPLGRTFLINAGVGGHFVPHRDHPSMPRQTFRLAAFLNNCAPMEYDWLMETDKKLPIELGRVYYINTRKTHRTISWTSDSIHLIINVPMTSENVAKVLYHLRHRH
jgi:hypothetical protein